MNEHESITVLQSHIDALRKEIQLRIESEQALRRTVIAGFAAFVTLRPALTIAVGQSETPGVDPRTLVPFIPTLLVLVATHWLNEGYYMLRTARAIAQAERRMNQLLGRVILEYETTNVQRHQQHLVAHRQVYFTASIILLIAHVIGTVVLTRVLWTDPWFATIIGTAAFVATLYGSVVLVRSDQQARAVMGENYASMLEPS